MEFLIIFLAVRLFGSAWDSKVDEYRSTQRETRKQINQRFPNASKDRRDQMVRNANRRKAAGYGFYQLRHGFPSLWTAVNDGWSDAREGHDAWSKRQAESDVKPRLRDAAREAWSGRKPRIELAPVPEPTPASRPTPEAKAPEAVPAPQPPKPTQPESAPTADGQGAKVFPFKQPVPINTTTPGETVEAPNIEAARQNAATEVAQLGARVSGWDQMMADLMAGGMGNDPQVMALAAQVQEHLSNAQAAAAAFIARLNAHAAGEEYANSGSAAKTEFLQHN
jgi:hypothetical protein